MNVFLRCKCGRAAGLARTKRAPGCDDKWCYAFKDGGVIRPETRGTTPFTNRTDAMRYADRMRSNYFKRKAGLPVDDDGDGETTTGTVRLADLATHFNEWVGGALPKTAQRYRRVVESFVEVVGGDALLHVVAADTSAIERWRGARRKETSRRERHQRVVKRQTINSDLIALRTLFRQASIWHGVRSPFTPVFRDGRMRSPIANDKIGKGERRQVVPLTAAEVDAATARLPEPFGLMCRATYQVLLRISEVRNLERRQVGVTTRADGSRHGWLQRDLKGGETKRVRIPIELADELLAKAETLPRGERLLFYDTPKNCSVVFRRLFDAQGKPWSHHWFRHSGITSMKDRGDVNDGAIVALAGWTGPGQLVTYNHISDLAVAHAADGNASLLAQARARRERGPASVHSIGGAR